MNFVEFMSKIFNRSLSLKEAQELINTQFGLVMAYIDQQNFKKIKEFRVYIVSVDYEFNFFVNANIINEWKNEEKLKGKLCKDAKTFIEVAENNGMVYSLDGFNNGLNLELQSNENLWFYITDKY